MNILKAINATLFFSVEIAMLALYAIAGWNINSSTEIGRWLLTILLPSIAIGLWAYFIAPNNSRRLKQPLLCIAQLTLFTFAALLAHNYIDSTYTAIYLSLGYTCAILAAYLKQ